MKIKCPKCKTQLEADESMRGCEVQCPECRHRFTISSVIKLKRARFNWSCYFLGVFFGLVGVFIAQAIDGANGVKTALRGFVIHLALCAGGYIALSGWAY